MIENKHNSVMTIPNDSNMVETNNMLKKYNATMHKILKLKLCDDFDNANVIYSCVKLYCDFDIFKNNNFFFTGLIKYKNEPYEIIYNEEKDTIVILNKNGKSEFTELYNHECKSLTDIGEFIFIDRYNLLERRVVDKTEVIPTTYN